MNRSIPKPPSGYIAQKRTNKTRIPKISKIAKPPPGYKEHLNKQDVKKGITYQLGKQQSANEKKGGSQKWAMDIINKWKKIPQQQKEYPGEIDLQALENKQIKANIGQEFLVTDAKESPDLQKDISQEYRITGKYNYDIVNITPSEDAPPSNTISDTMESWARKKQWNKIVREAAKIGEARELGQKRKKSQKDAKILNVKHQIQYELDEQERLRLIAERLAKHKRQSTAPPQYPPRDRDWTYDPYWQCLRWMFRKKRLTKQGRQDILKRAPANTLKDHDKAFPLLKRLQKLETRFQSTRYSHPLKKIKPNPPSGKITSEHQTSNASQTNSAATDDNYLYSVSSQSSHEISEKN